MTHSEQRPGRRAAATGGLALVYGGGFVSYADSAMTPVKLAAYVAVLAGLAVLVAGSGRLSRSRLVFIGVFCFGHAQATLASMFAAGTVVGPVQVAQEMLYPVVLFVSALVLHRIRDVRHGPLRTLILALAAANFGAAALASLGLLGSVPVFGDIVVGRAIFGTSLPSAAGLTFNVNYYAVSQGCFLMLYGLLAHLGGRWTARDRVILAALFLSTFWGSSRGVLLALAGAAAAMLLVNAVWGPPRRARIARAVLCGLVAAVVIAFSVYYEQIYDVFRLAKGLNRRDLIWSQGVDLWLQRPVLGWGLDVEVAQRFAAGALPEGVSFHSGYLHTLVRGGVALFVFSFGFLILGVAWGLGFSGPRWCAYHWEVGVVVFYLINGAFRTYSLGGMGLLPALAVTALSTCLHARASGDVRC
ncbi:MAG TPA: O-antigen ligase family protein [Candidatus Krumholzibacteria bacterium]|nr:O-antigen ligase family protein [Candidatus Krumholzibacteria bacterium]HPD71316.1 O-antigen ligase family protein [Candidatus Krumholzibacteria bacterium]HRY38984.1 O-antigen ligase family protein [Candidatus Krumholzibacteria bacterium]